MKPQEILSMIEEAAGTSLYESKKQSALKTIEKKDNKLIDINKIIYEELNPTLGFYQNVTSFYISLLVRSRLGSLFILYFTHLNLVRSRLG